MEGMEGGALGERLKELDCLYGISSLLSRESLTIDEILGRVVAIIPAAWQHPERTRARIVLGGRDVGPHDPAGTGPTLVEPIALRGRESGFVEVSVAGVDPAAGRDVFLPDERRLLKAIAELVGGIAERKEAETALRQATEELDRKNAALKEIISQIESEKRELQEQCRANIESAVLPVLNRLKNPDQGLEARLSCVRIVEQSLKDIASAFSRKVMSERVRLSPREVEVSNLIRNGMSNKEIAELLGVSVLTVERHRHNIRRKLHISGEKVNLSTYLREL